MKAQKGATVLAAWLFVLVLVGLFLGACAPGAGQGMEYDLFSQERTARLAARVPTDSPPSSVTVFDRAEHGAYLSSGARMQLSDDGTVLYVLDRGAVAVVDLVFGRIHAAVDVCSGASSILLAPDGLTLLVSCADDGNILFLDLTRNEVADRLRVCDRVDHLAQDPSGRVVYAACQSPAGIAVVIHELSLDRPSTSARLLVAGDLPGPIQVRNADGCRLWDTEPMPGWVGGFVLLPGTEIAAAAYTRVDFSGEVGVWGDGKMVLEQGVVTVDLETGHVATVRAEGGVGRTWMQQPGRVAVLPETGELIVPMPGWGEVLRVQPLSQGEVSEGPEPEVKSSGRVVGRARVEGRPEEVIAASLSPDAVYVLDGQTGSITVLDGDLTVTRVISL